MSKLPCPKELWPRFSVALDALLDLPAEERRAWLEATTDRELVPWLAAVVLPDTDPHWLESPPAIADGLAAGDAVGPWRLVRPIGSGGMGVVWLAARADGAYTREVALKLPHAHLLVGALKDRFARERNILAGLDHPNIARFFDAGLAEDGQPWLALEYVQGAPITAYCAALDVNGCVAVLQQVALAVAAAHARLVVHRDLKPANVLVTSEGRVKLLDFGIAKLLDDQDEGLTRATGRLATPAYAAPEQLNGGNVTVATDVYALGVMLRELSARRSVPADLAAIIDTACAADPAQRYVSMEAFGADLERFRARLPVAARRTSRGRRALLFVRRNARLVGLGVAIALLCVAGGVAVMWQARRAAEEARRAEAIKDFLVEVFAASDPRIAADAPRGTITAKALLDASAPKIAERFANDPVVQIELLRTVADLYSELGDDERYEQLQALQLQKSREVYGVLHANVVEGAIEAAHKTCTRRDAERCGAALAEADRLLKASGNDGGRLRAQWLLDQGLQVQARDGGTDEAQRTFERALAIFESEAPRSRGHVTALNELGSLFLSQRLDYPQAIAFLGRAAELALTIEGRNDAELQTIYGNMGIAYQQSGRFEEAARAFQRSAAIAERTTGPAFPTAWVPRGNAARTLHLAGKREEAIAEFEALMPLIEHEDRLEATTVRQNFGDRLASEGRPVDGITHLETALASFRKQASYAFQERLTMRQLGDAYARAGRHHEAGTTLHAALDAYLASGTDKIQPVMAAREALGRWYLDDSKPDRAAEHFRAVVDNADGRINAHIVLAHAGLARAALARRELEAALTFSETALAQWPQVVGFRDVRMEPYVQRVRADALVARGDLADAQKLEDAAAEASARFDHPSSPTRTRRIFQ